MPFLSSCARRPRTQTADLYVYRPSVGRPHVWRVCASGCVPNNPFDPRLASAHWQLHVTRHAPAKESLLFVTGLSKPIIPLAGLVGGLAAVILAAPLLAVIPLLVGTENEERGA